MDAAVRAYQTSAHQAMREQMIIDHLPAVRQILGRMMTTLPDHLDRENLEAAGVLGLVEAAHHYDPGRNVEFGAFALFRIRGAILDELRRNCPLPQHMLEKWARVREALAHFDGLASIEEVAAKCGCTEKELEECLDAIRLTRPEAWDETFDLAGTEPVSEMEREDRTSRLADAIAQLDDRLRAIVAMYHRDEMTLKEIGEVMGLSESRISRLLQHAHLHLKLILGNEFKVS